MIEFLNLHDELFRNLASGFAAIIASYVAIVGLRTWRKQVKGKTEYELARRLIKGIYELRNAMISIRLPHRRADWDAYEKPWERVTNALEKINLELLEAEAIWGPEIVEKVKNVESFSSELLISLGRVIRKDFKERKLKDQERLYNVIYEGAYGDEKDGFNDSFLTSIKEVEKFLKPI